MDNTLGSLSDPLAGREFLPYFNQLALANPRPGAGRAKGRAPGETASP